MTKKIIEYCDVCKEHTTHTKKHKSKLKGKDLNLYYCNKCRTGYTKQLVGRNK